MLGLLQTAASKRSVARTALNDRSSRSHCVFQLHIQGSNASRALRCSCERLFLGFSSSPGGADLLFLTRNPPPTQWC